MSERIESRQLPAEHRTYFFDVFRQTESKSFLKITESKKVDESFERATILVDEKFIDAFINELYELRTSLKRLNNIAKLEKQKSLYHNAYKPWTHDDDERLEILYCEGKTTKELSALFGRNRGAITSRIKKLELKEKYR